jgi:hypothetical protein
MKYREVGEKFEYEGVMLEVKQSKPDTCDECFFISSECKYTYCSKCLRKDETPIIYKEVKDESNN